MKNYMNFIASTPIIIAILLISSSASAAPRSTELEILASANGNEVRSSDLVAEVNYAEKSEEGNLVAVTWSIKNEGSGHVVLSWFNEHTYTYNGPTFAGVTALDPESGTRFQPIMDGENYCLCSGEYSAQLQETALPENTVTYWSLYSIPEEINKFSLEIPEFELLEDIPIS